MAKLTEARQETITAIRQSGLFLSSWYLQHHPELTAQGEDGIAHFCATGWQEGAQPNPYFSPAFYIAANPDIAAAGVNPLLHYIAFGDAEGRDPGPFFHVNWYRAEYGIGPGTLCLAHFLSRRLTGQVNPVPVFDAAYYLENNPDLAAASVDPFEHFLAFGAAEARQPSASFDVRFYTNRYAAALNGSNPLLHYLAHIDSGNFLPRRPVEEELIPGAVRRATRPSLHFEELRPVAANAPRKAKLLAYYLPQFHHVPENDAWWGKGFTDWTNLSRALPRYVGHLQPRVPRDLGFYSLDDPATLRRQIELAKAGGLFGFVFYFYWFNRHRLLEKPLEQLLGDASLDFPFCVMWANENWTRRWDGLEREVLIAQQYRGSDDDALIACFARLFADPRYIRIGGRPVLMIYRIALIPDAAARISQWREMFLEQHGENPLIIMAQSLGEYEPEPYGLDGAVEFPPHKLSPEATTLNPGLDLLDPDFSAAVYDYADIAKVSVEMAVPKFPLIKTIVPGWDNDPRREGQGLVLHDATPAKYQAWLERLVDHAAAHPFHGEAIICVNAWNEWAEGAFLEPDLHYGAAFLNATGRALCVRDLSDLPAGILLIGHDAQPHGAQMLLLHIARQLSRRHGVKVHLLLLGVGPLLGKYFEAAEVSVAYDKTIIGNLLDKYREAGIRTAIINSAASARVVPWLAARGFATSLLVHEMPRLLKEYNLEVQASRGAAAADRVIFSNAYVAQTFAEAIGLPGKNAALLAQGNYQNIRYDAESRQQARRALGIAKTSYMILGAGFADMRKGFDLFLQMFRHLDAQRRDIHFVWVGEIQFTLATYLGPEIAKATSSGRFHHVSFTDAVAKYFAAADVYALTSREDPYPTVVLEALACGVPCVCFAETGGIPELLAGIAGGLAVPLGDTAAFEAALLSLLNHKSLTSHRQRLIDTSTKQFDFAAYVEKLLRLAQPALKSVSVCVLNYNYARYLPGRLNSVFAQTYPVSEILVFDDASQDDSNAVAAACAARANREITVIANQTNSGSVFAQWRRAAQAATGAYVWIAEADDECSPDFLSRLIEAMEASPEQVLLAFTDSKAIDATGNVTMPSYRSYYFASGAKQLGESGIWPATEFATNFLATRNLILNVSAVLWRREALLKALDGCAETISSWRIAGDWRLYLELMTQGGGSIVYLAEPLNSHRRHQASVVHSLDATTHVDEIRQLHELAAAKLNLAATARKRQKDYQAEVAQTLAQAPAAKRGAGRKPKTAPGDFVARQHKV